MAEELSYKILYTRRSLKDALAIKEYLLYKFTEKEVENFYHMLGVFEKLVLQFPHLYPQSPGSKNIRRAVLSRQLSVFYIDTKKTLKIIAILDNRMSTNKWPV